MKRLALAVCALCLAPVAVAQTGYPLYGSIQSGPIDSVNLQNLNTVISIPVMSTRGRAGTNFGLSLRYNSLNWIISGNTWQPAPNGGWVKNPLFGSVTNSTTFINGNCGKCIAGEGCQGEKDTTKWSNYVYTDSAGTPHGFLISVTEIYNSCTGDDTFSGSWSGVSTDGLYNINIGTVGSEPSQKIVYSTQTGTKLDLTNPNFIIVTDRNGNEITETTSVQTSTWVDTAGHTVLTQEPSGSNVEYHYTAPDGSDQKFVLKYQNYSVMTHFGCSNALEYNAGGTLAQWSLPYELDLPNGKSYTFNYEGTPGHQGYYTGRISEVTLPTGGSYTYTYGGTNDGVSCSTGNIINLGRQISDGTNTATWQYINAPSGTNFATTVTAPQMPYDSAANQTVYTFNSSGQQITEQDYQGAAGGTLLKTVNSTWATNGSPATAVTVLPNNQQSEVATTYDNLAHLDQMVEYDWGQGAVGNKIRTTNVTYTTINAPVSFLVLSEKQVLDGGGNVASQEDITYDGSTPSCISGAAQHDDTNFGCSYTTRGNPTTITDYALPATQGGALTRALTYNTLGDVLTISLNGTQQKQLVFSTTTNYSYPDTVGVGGLTETYTYNPFTGQMASDKDPNNATTSYNYDIMKRLTTVTRPDNLQVTTTYGDSAPPTLTTKTPIDASGDVVQVVTGYDGLGRPVSATKENASGAAFSQVETVYDPMGRVYKTSSPYLGSPSSWSIEQFDSLSRPASKTDAGGGSVSFSYIGNDVYQTVGPAPAGENPKIKQSEYNGIGQLMSVCEITAGTSVAPAGSCTQTNSVTGYWTQYTYNVLGDLLTVKQNAQSLSSSQSRTYTYDGLGRMTSEQNPETGATAIAYVYDTDATCGASNGDLVKKSDAAGNVTCYAYDQLHRVTQISYPSGPNAANTPSKYFFYDTPGSGWNLSNTQGRLWGAHTCFSPCSTLITDEVFSYTVLGQVSDVYESTPHSGGYFHVNELYWANGAVNQISGLTGLPTFSYGIDGEGRPFSTSASSGQNPVTSTSYNVAGEVTGLTFGSGDSEAFQFDTNTFRMTQYKYTVGATPKSVVGNLTWNANGTLQTLNITDPFNAANTQNCTYSYDDLARLASGNCGSVWAQTFSYDAFGNITKSGSMSFQPGYNADNQMLTGATYDLNGNVLHDSLHTFAYDSNARPTTIDTVAATYDAFGRMVEQTKSGVNTEIVYAPSGEKLALMKGLTTIDHAFVPLPGGATAVYTSGGLFYYRYPDWLGSSRFSSTPGRGMHTDLAFAPYGEQYSVSGSVGVAGASFAGNNEDTTTNLYDAQLREYEIFGRWPSPDSAGMASANPANPQSWNRYAYVMNNPLGFIDPAGLDPEQGPDGCIWDPTTATLFCPPLEGSGGGGGGGGVGGPGGCTLGIIISPGMLHPEGDCERGGGGGGGGRGGTGGGGGTGGTGGTGSQTSPQPSAATQYWNCVKDSGNEASLQGLLGLDNSKIAGAFLGNPISDLIQLATGNGGSPAGVDAGLYAATKAAPAVPNVSVSYTSTIITASPSELSIITSKISAYLPLGDIASGAADVLGGFTKLVQAPIDITASAFGAVVCAGGPPGG